LAILGLARADAAALGITTTVTPAKPKPGQGVTVTSKVTNTQTARPALTVTATASWIDTQGAAQTSTNSASIQVVQPVTVIELKYTLPTGITYTSGTATVNGLTVVPTQAGAVLTVPVAITLNEAEFATVLFGLAVP